MDIKSWILIGGGLLLLAVIGHGFWLAWRSRRDDLRLEIDPNIPREDIDPLELLRGELPNGGARLRSSGPVQQERLSFPDAEPPAEAGLEADAAHEEPYGVATGGQRPHAGGARSAAPDALLARASDRLVGARSTREGASRSAGTRERTQPRPSPTGPAPAAGVASEPRRERMREAPPGGERASGFSAGPEAGEEPKQPPQPDEVIAINVLARHGGRFHGRELMEVFARNGLKFGDMNIFHRLDPVTRRPQFSVASAVEPGTFDPGAMEQFETRGVALFMPLPGPERPLESFDDMLSVARDIASSLGGDLKDERMSVMTAQNIEHCRQRITDFTRRQLSQRS